MSVDQNFACLIRNWEIIFKYGEKGYFFLKKEKRKKKEYFEVDWHLNK